MIAICILTTIAVLAWTTRIKVYGGKEKGGIEGWGELTRDVDGGTVLREGTGI